jgi:hypothetical protein
MKIKEKGQFWVNYATGSAKLFTSLTDAINFAESLDTTQEPVSIWDFTGSPKKIKYKHDNNEKNKIYQKIN